ncbi:hypothetical protein LWI28_027165 [Acer negundo]|uniref:Pectinesterase catalytic domain-containing protein n=1 Tax=Acer negundo TaxID=4023 RepID=A0AAD5NYR6_ACENE|nr:hypothetical protein LWI28_027165 [Acer negundo]
MYIDAEGTFRPQRLLQIAERCCTVTLRLLCCSAVCDIIMSVVNAAAITGDGFIARDIRFHNTAGPQGEQALALHIASDHSNCYLAIRRRQGSGYNAILANGRSDPGQSTGFSVQKCRITAASDFSPVGRPWKQYSRSVVRQSTIDDFVAWRGAGTSKRVNWPGFHVIDASEAVKFTVGSFISGTSWLPSTGVTFVSGLQ